MDDSSSTPSAGSIEELVPPVRQKLKQFAPETPYDPDHIKCALQIIVKNGRVKGIELLPDMKSLRPRAEGNTYLLLVAHTCKAFVDPAVAGKKRVPRHQKDFIFELGNEIHRLENGEALFSAWNG
jgi:hypothetical protein